MMARFSSSLPVEADRDRYVYLMVARLICSASLVWAWLNLSQVQTGVDVVWGTLQRNPFYRSVFFETAYTIQIGALLMLVFWTLERIPQVQERCMHRRSSGNEYVEPPSLNRWKAFTKVTKHFLMFGLLDPVTPKRYGHVDSRLYGLRTGRFHLERLLPGHAPTVGQLLGETLVAMILYDAFFFLFHLLMHKVPYLWKTVHRHHHDHRVISAYDDTLRLHTFEHLMLVLLGNEALRLTGAHPMSRTLFNTWLVYALVSNHSAMDLPLSLEKIVPFGLLQGPQDHEVHHVKNPSRNFAPVFTHCDRLLNILQSSGASCVSPESVAQH